MKLITSHLLVLILSTASSLPLIKADHDRLITDNDVTDFLGDLLTDDLPQNKADEFVNEREELAELSRRVLAWCQENGHCSNDLLSQETLNPSVVEQENHRKRRSASPFYDMCRMYKRMSDNKQEAVNGQQFKVPILCRREDDSDGDVISSSNKKRAASPLRDMCKFYGMRCKRSGISSNSLLMPMDEIKSIGSLLALREEDGDDLYEMIVDRFLELCRTRQQCDFRVFLAKLNDAIRSVNRQQLLQTSQQKQGQGYDDDNDDNDDDVKVV